MEWEKFIVPRWFWDDVGPPPVSPPASSPASDEPAREQRSPVLDTWREVTDIVRLDDGERSEFEKVLRQVTHAVPLPIWPVAEPLPVGLWRHGLIQRVRRSDVAAAILHALDPYHALIRQAHPAIHNVVVYLPAIQVTEVRQRAIMTSWAERMASIVDRDVTEAAAWKRYWATISSRGGSHQDTVAWLQGVRERASGAGVVALHIIDAVRARDNAMASILALARPVGTIAIQVPGLT